MSILTKLPIRLKFVCGLFIELILVLFIILKHFGIIPSIHFIYALMGIPIGVLISNLASAEIVGFIKDEYLWKKVRKKYKPPKNSGYDSLEEWWKSGEHGSNISYELGIIQRVVLLFAGVISIRMFFAAAAAWSTFLLAVDWKSTRDQYRSIGHIYAISVALSMLLSAIDVFAIRVLLELPLIGQ